MQVRTFAFIAAVAIACLGAILFFTPVSSAGTSCGTALEPSALNSDSLELLSAVLSPSEIALQEAIAGRGHRLCDDAISTRQTWAWSLMGVGVVACIGIGVMSRREDIQAA